MDLKKYLQQDGILIKESFLDEKVFEQLKKDFDTFQYIEHYQPSHFPYGNRFQSYPCYDSFIQDHKWGKFIKKEIEKFLKAKIFDYTLVARRIVMNEVRQSQFDRDYAGVHHDGEMCKFAGVLYFDQSYKGGTGFFRYNFDQKPDAYISAKPNRLIIYRGSRWHAPFNDFTYHVRTVMPFFFDF
jgi:hypothetical protein